MSKFKNLAYLCLLTLGGCMPISTVPVLTPLEIQSIQSREYEHDRDIVFSSVMSVFQDLGYIVNSASKDTGLITAESAAVSNEALSFWFGITEVLQTKATAFIEQTGSGTRVRLNFLTTKNQSSGYGQTDRQDSPILDVTVYQNAFERVENAIFIRSDN